MAGGFHFLNPKTRQDKVQLAFIVIGGAFSMVLTAATPFLTYMLFTGIVASLTYSYSYWENLAKVKKDRTQPAIPSETPSRHPPNNRERNQEEAMMGDVITKVVIATLITVIGLYFSLYFVAVSQLIVGTFVGSALSWFFIDQCVVDSQNALNQALEKAVKQTKPQIALKLIRRGADPYATDKKGNNAFHHAIQNNAHAATLINLFKSKESGRKITFKQVLATFKVFMSQEIKERISDLVTPFRNTLRENSQENRLAFYQALGQLVNALYMAGVTLVNTLVKYLRQEIANPKNINKQNQAGLTPHDLVSTRHISPQYRKRIVNALGDKPLSRKRARDNIRSPQWVEKPSIKKSQNLFVSPRPLAGEGLKTRILKRKLRRS